MLNPFQDLFAFFEKNTLHGRFPIYALIFLLIASVVIALITLARDSEQRNIQNVYMLASALLRWRHVVPADALEDATHLH